MRLSELDTYQERKEFILEKIEKNALFNEDTTATVGDFKFITQPFPDFQLTQKYSETYEEDTYVSISEHAKSQFLNRLKIPVSYFDRCPENLKADNVNYWINYYRHKNLLIRWDGEEIRAIFSTRFTPELDDTTVFPLVLNTLETQFEPHTLHIRDFKQVGDFTVLKILFKDAKVEYEGRAYFAGLLVCNSEVGRSSVWIKPFIRGGNSSGAYDFSDISREGTKSIRHITGMTAETVVEAILASRETAEAGIYQLLNASKEIVERPVQVVESLVKEHNFLSKQLLNAMKEQYEHAQDVTRLQLAQSMLETVSHLPLYRKYLAEAAIGRSLDLFRDTKKRLQAVAEDMKQVQNL